MMAMGKRTACCIVLTFLLLTVYSYPFVEGLNLIQIQAISIYSPKDGFVYMDSVPLNYRGLDNVAGYRYAVPSFNYGDTRVWASETLSYSLDGQTNITIPKSNFLFGLSNGSHSIRLFQFLIYYNDFYMSGVGPQPFGAAFSNTVNFTFVNTVPIISNLTVENRTYITRSIPLNFTVNEPAASLSYSLDNQANITVFGNTTLTGLMEGTHSITIYANDTVGNIGKSGTVFFTISLPTPTPSPSPSLSSSTQQLAQSSSPLPTIHGPPTDFFTLPVLVGIFMTVVAWAIVIGGAIYLRKLNKKKS